MTANSVREPGRRAALAVQWLFALTLAALPLQYWGIVRRQAEPWPAIVMPGFTSVPSSSDTFYVETTTFVASFDDDTSLDVTVQELLAGVPRSHHDAIVYSHFSYHGERSPADRAWLRDRLAPLHEGARLSHVDVVWRLHTLEVRDDDVSKSGAVTDSIRIDLRS